MRERLGDLGERVAQKMTVDSCAPVAEAAALTEEAALSSDSTLANLTKIRFSWRPEDRAILERIRAAGDAAFEESFGEVIEIVDDLFATLRVYEYHNGMVVRDVTGRPVWKTENGRIVEEWSQLTGQDVEEALVRLGRVRLMIAPRVNELMLEALYARHCAQDIHDDVWGSMMDGTQGDKGAKANRESRQERYHAFFRFYLYSVSKTFLDEINEFMRHLTNVRAWGVRSQQQ